MSSYRGSRYDGDRRSRSPRGDRDRSPYGSQYGDADRRRSSAESRLNNPNPFPPGGRGGDGGFRDMAGREPPRGPKALIEPPSGPRGSGGAGGFGASDFRGGGRGAGVNSRGGRGRGWRDDSRDRGRDRELPDPRDRPPPFRDERSRERERERDREREWRDRERDRETFRRRLSPQGRGRSPPGRDFREPRDLPPSLDAERARRESRDGPLSAGSSSSDPPFAGPGQFARGPYPNRGGRGASRGGRPEWDRGARGGRMWDDRDRYGPPGRSRSQEGRWDQDNRDRRDHQYDVRRDIRDDIRDRDPRDRDRDLNPRKNDRVSLEPSPSTKDVSPPPVAPSAPAFGSVPSRQPSTADIQSVTGKAPPTGPRALTVTETQTRPVSAGHAGPSDHPTPTGPAKQNIAEGSPPIPVGPRAQQQKQQRSSKQWINPALTGKKVPDSPKLGRSQSFASQQGRPFGHRPESSHSDQHGEYERRPRSSDAHSESQLTSTDGKLKGLHISESGDGAIRSMRGTQSARASVDRDGAYGSSSSGAMLEEGEISTAHEESHHEEHFRAPAKPMTPDHRSEKAPPSNADEADKDKSEPPADGDSTKQPKPFPACFKRRKLPPKQTQEQVPVSEQTSESDDDEDMDEYFRSEFAKVQAEMDKLQEAEDEVPISVVHNYTSIFHDTIARIATSQEQILEAVGPMPEGTTFPLPWAGTRSAAVVKTVPHVNKDDDRMEIDGGNTGATSEGAANVSTQGTAVNREADVAASKEAEAQIQGDAKESAKEPEKVGDKSSKKSDQGPKGEPDRDSGQELGKEIEKGAVKPSTEATVSEVAKVADKETDKRVVDKVPVESTADVNGAGVERAPESVKGSPLPAREQSPIPTVEHAEGPSGEAQANAQPVLRPKVEEIDTGGSGLQALPLPEHPRQDEDVDMMDVHSAEDAPKAITHPQTANGVHLDGVQHLIPEIPFEQAGSRPMSPSHMDEDSEDKTEDDASVYGSLEAVRELAATPPLDDLPVFNVKPWQEMKSLRKKWEPSPEFDAFLRGKLTAKAAAKKEEQDVARQDYANKYENYLRFTMSDDPVAVKSRAHFAAAMAGPTQAANGRPAPQEAKPDGGRRGVRNFGTELDITNLLEQSKREEEERKQRLLRIQKEKFASDKEAVIPAMYWTEEEKQAQDFYDTSGYIPVEKLVSKWQVLPPKVNFTEEEAEQFEKSYLESPKQWGKIARDLPRRNFGTCIQYYYSMKRELNLKEKLKKRPKGRRKARQSNKQRSSALVSELGNPENGAEEDNQENGENGERRRPRRAAAPSWGYDAAANADSDGNTPGATPSRRRNAAAASENNSGAERPEQPKKRGKRQTKAEKEAAKAAAAAAAAARTPQAIAPTPPANPPMSTTPVPVPTIGQPGAGKSGRSRSNSRVQGTEWVQPQTPADLAARAHGQQQHLEGLSQGLGVGMAVNMGMGMNMGVGMQQQPLGGAPVQRPPHLSSPDKMGTPLMAASTISEVMAPPSLRPEPPPPPPPSTLPTFDIGQPSTGPSTGTERLRPNQQPTSYWSVSETTDFPALLRSFGTDWPAIAGYMQSKTAVMVKNYYTKHKGTFPEWEQLVTEADAKVHRGEKRPAPPVPSTAPRKRYDTPSSSGNHRPLAAADASDGGKGDIQVPQGTTPSFSRFQVPLAQAPPQQQQTPPQPAAPQPTLAQPALAPGPGPSSVLAPPGPVSPALPPSQSGTIQPGPASASGGGSQMSPTHRPLRPPVAPFAYPDKEIESQPSHVSQPPQQQSVRMSSKPSPAHATSPGPVSVPGPSPGPSAGPGPTHGGQEPMSSRAGWAADQFNLVPQRKDLREAQEQRQARQELPARVPSRTSERPPVRPKQEPDTMSAMPPRGYEPFQTPQPPRAVAPRSEPLSLAKAPEPARIVPPAQQAYVPPMQTGRALLSDALQQQQQQQSPAASPHVERPLSSLQRTMAPPMQNPYDAPPSGPPQTPAPSSTPTPTRPSEPRKTSNLMALLNDDPPPKRVSEVTSGLKAPSTTPPPQGMLSRPVQPPPPTSTPTPQRREETGGYPYLATRQPTQSAIPPLKPYHTQSPQPPHMAAPRSAMVTPIDAAGAAERDQFRYSYGASSAHQSPAANSPQAHHRPGPPPVAQTSYPSQQSYPPYGVTQSHAPTPTAPYSHPARDQGWPSREPPSAAPMQQQYQAQSSWPPSQHAPQPKSNPHPVPAPSAWGAQHGGPPKPQVQVAPQQQGPHGGWPSAGASQQPHPLSLREDPRYVQHERSSSVGMGAHHSPHGSLGGGSRYPPAAQDPRDPRRADPGPPPPSAYQRGYGSTPAPQQGPVPVPQGRDPRDPRDARDMRDPRDQVPPPRSYTPVAGYGERVYPGAPQAQHQQEAAMRDAQYREQMQREQMQREQMQMQRGVGDPRDPRDPREAAVAQQQAQQQQQAGQPLRGLMSGELRPYNSYDRGASDRRF